MRNLQNWLDDYGVSHQNKTNKLIHWFCVPIIFFSAIGLLASIPHNFMFNWFGGVGEGLKPYIHFGTLVVVFSLFFYLRLSVVMAAGILLYCLFCLFGVAKILTVVPFGFELWQISLTLFVLAWIIQFIGHKIEGEKPSFLDDLQFLLIGPAWLIHFIYKKLGIKF